MRYIRPERWEHEAQDSAANLLDMGKASRWGHTDVDDPALEAACTSALRTIEQRTGAALRTATVTYYYAHPPIHDCVALLMPFPPVKEITGVEIEQPDGSWEPTEAYRTHLPEDDYGRLYATDEWPWPAWTAPDERVRVTAEVGWGADLPEDIHLAALMLGLYLYESRGGSHGDAYTDSGAQQLVQPYTMRRAG